MTLTKNNVRNHFSFIIFFITFLVVGISTYKDYGISWDEPISRDRNGVLNYNFMTTGDYQPVITGNEKYHGPSFEIFLVWLEHVFGLKNTQDIYLMRHLSTFLAFAASVFFFYLLCVRYLKSKVLGIVGVVFLVLSPRIYADAFYNSKDLTFMSFVIINLYTTLRFLERKNFINALFHAIVCGIVIDIRILGIVIPCFTFLFLFIEFIKSSDQRKKILIYSLLFLFLLVGSIILLWPVLWRHPLDNFIFAMKEMSKYPWGGSVFYFGKLIDATLLPWHYIPVWILISTPLLFILFFFLGIAVLLRKIIRRTPFSTFEWLNLYIFFLPLLAIILLHSVVYDGWRHMYFIYPSFIVISLFGVENIFALLKKNKILFNSAITAITIYIIFIGLQMFQLHPYENVYFNFLAGNSISEAKKNFELDYWGLSYKDGLDHILKNDSSPNIVINATESTPVMNNIMMFPDLEQTRFSYTDETELADYFMSSFRSHHAEFNYVADFNIIRDNGNILSVYDLRKKGQKVFDKKYEVAHYFNSNENKSEEWWQEHIIVDPGAFSGQNVEMAGNTEFVSNFSCNPAAGLFTDTSARNYLTFSFQIKTELSFDLQIVCQIDSGNGKMYKWIGQRAQSNFKDAWTKRNFRTALPKILSPHDRIKVYIWNLNKNNFIVDDMEIGMYSVPGSDVQLILKSLP